LILGISNICLRLNFSHALILNENSNFSKYPYALYPFTTRFQLPFAPPAAGLNPALRLGLADFAGAALALADQPAAKLC
ncbi:MAG: hypothetical protein V3T68_03090, partial [Dehalococcoidales bacterium]